MFLTVIDFACDNRLSLRASLTTGHIPIIWTRAKWSSLPNLVETTYGKSIIFRPITRSSFMLKTIEQVIDGYVKEKLPTTRSLHQNINHSNPEKQLFTHS